MIDRRIIVPGGIKCGPIRSLAHIDGYVSTVELHQYPRAAGADKRQISKLFHIKPFPSFNCAAAIPATGG